MLLTITATHRPATDLGFLLMKNPDNVHSVELSFGNATLFYPETSEGRCTAAITLEIDAVELVRGKGSIEDQYVNDRPYAASSLLSVALGRLLNTAMGGRSKLRQELAAQTIPLEATITPPPARGAADLLAKLFEPLPVLDNNKHYYVGEAEVEKLLRKGEGSLETHPARELIVRRYLCGFGGLVRKANSQLEDRVEAEDAEEHAQRDSAEEAIEKPIRLNDQRMERVVALIRELGAISVLDLGCGEGRLLRELLNVPGLSKITGVEVAPRVLAGAGDRLKLNYMPDIKRQRIELLQGSLVYRDDRLQGFNAAAVIEVIQHM